MVARSVNPKAQAATEKLMEYWSHGPGAAKIRWGTANDFSRCLLELTPHVGKRVAGGLCQHLHQRATGFSNGKAPGEPR